MEIRRATYGAAIRLAIVFSAAAAVIAIGLDVVGDVAPLRLATAVALLGFGASWVQTGRVTRAVEARASHRPGATSPLRQSIG